jgi:lon-related putative ATP-dependent protease
VPTVIPLDASVLYRRCDPADLDFETTADLDHDAAIVGQARATEAVRFGVGVGREGYNIFALGPTGAGKHFLVNHYVQEVAAGHPVPSDICYVHNFAEPHKSCVLQVPPGTGNRLKRDMTELVEELRTSLSRAFESEEYQNRRRVLEQKFEEEPEQAFEALRQKAKERKYALLRTPVGLVFAPLKGEDDVLPPDEFKALPEADRKRMEAEIEELQVEVQKILRQMPRWQRELHEQMRALHREVTESAIGHIIDATREQYAELPQVTTFLDAVHADILDHAADFLAQAQPQGESGPQEGAPTGVAATGFVPTGEPMPLRRYQVNVIVDHEGSPHAPVVYEDNPTYTNLVGRVEHIAQMGALVTDFTLIRAGALHRANGGYLILDARAVLLQPFSWDALKRSLRTRQVRIESLGQALSVISTVSLEPEPLPLDVKVVLVGEPQLYYLLYAYDPDFQQLFKVSADFDDRIPRTPDNQRLYARLVGSIARQAELRPFDRTAVARIVEHGARLADDAERLSIHADSLADLLKEADYWAGVGGHDVVSVAEVQHAIDAQMFRADRLRERSQEAILRDTIFIDTTGSQVGQINGLSVIDLGRFAFGRPSRITARVRLGKGEVVDIEREVELGGPIHSKGVLILSSFLGARYSADRPLSLSASLVFEQSYGGVEGDSASSAELYVLLSAISGVPIRQSLAVTGSVNQLGQVQPIGGVNEKIEGFFDICRARGLTGDQGVLIPASNVKHLMLRHDVVEACADGRFRIYPVTTIDQGIELLTGVPAGERDAAGGYPEGSINALVEARLTELAEKRQALFESAEKKAGT